MTQPTTQLAPGITLERNVYARGLSSQHRLLVEPEGRFPLTDGQADTLEAALTPVEYHVAASGLTLAMDAAGYGCPVDDFDPRQMVVELARRGFALHRIGGAK